MQSRKIILWTMGAAIVYGIAHDMVTARVCVEYFTVGHRPVFPTESPTLLAMSFGIRATWWAGLILGVAAALASRVGAWPKLDAARWIRPGACLLIVMAAASLLAGVTGYQLAKAVGFVVPEPLGSRVPKDRHCLFFADSMAHLAAYSVGLLGGLGLCLDAIVRRYRAARTEPLSKAGAACIDVRAESWIIVACRWTVRAVSVPLFVLIVLLTMGDGVPNPFAASLRQNLLLAADLAMLAGLIAAWKWEGLGGLTILAALGLFAAADGTFLLRIVLTPWLVAGLLSLVCWAGRRRR